MIQSRSVCASAVVHSRGRSRRWTAIFRRISASDRRAVATNVTRAKRDASAWAVAALAAAHPSQHEHYRVGVIPVEAGTGHRHCLRERNGGQRWRQDCAWKTAGGRRFQCTLSVVAESRPQNPWVGLLARKKRIARMPIRWPLHLPRLMGRVVRRSGAPSLTVAGPRRICTGLPFYAPRGTQGKVRC